MEERLSVETRMHSESAEWGAWGELRSRDLISERGGEASRLVGIRRSRTSEDDDDEWETWGERYSFAPTRAEGRAHPDPGPDPDPNLDPNPARHRRGPRGVRAHSVR